MHATRLRKVGGSVMLGVPPVLLDRREAGLVRCDQPRAFDLDARGGRLIESVPDEVMDDVPANVVAMSA